MKLHSTNVTIKTGDRSNIQFCNSTSDQIRIITRQYKPYVGETEIITFVNVEDLAKALDMTGYKLEAK
ncbi:hypothetical protein [Pseudobutyrivibrio sp.]